MRRVDRAPSFQSFKLRAFFVFQVRRICALAERTIIGLIVYVPVLQRVVGTGALPWYAWCWLMLFIPLLPVADELRKALARRWHPTSMEVPTA